MADSPFQCWWCKRDGPPSPEPSLAYRWCAVCMPGAAAIAAGGRPETRPDPRAVVSSRAAARATEARLLAHLLIHGPSIVAELAGRLDVPTETVRDRLVALAEDGLVECAAETMPRGGVRYRYDVTARGGERVAA